MQNWVNVGDAKVKGELSDDQHLKQTCQSEASKSFQLKLTLSQIARRQDEAEGLFRQLVGSRQVRPDTKLIRRWDAKA